MPILTILFCKYSFFDRWSLCAPKFEIQDADRNPVLLIEGPICTISMCGDVEFQVRIFCFITNVSSVRIYIMQNEFGKNVMVRQINMEKLFHKFKQKFELKFDN